MTQRQLAKAIGVTLVTIQNWKRGRLAISAKRLDRLLTRYIASRLTY
jgi:transcriptional regulator with XRE-family HTH domain